MNTLQNRRAVTARSSWALWASLAISFGCESTTNLASSREREGGAQARDAANEVAPDAQIDVVFTDGGTAMCGKVACACSNGRNDDDGQDDLVDGFDPECTGPADNDERTFATGETKQGNPRCVDCFFDGNAASGDDGCRIAASCGVTGDARGGQGSCNSCAPEQACVNSCLPRTPNGCDCFGCCAIRHAGFAGNVQLVETCSVEQLGNDANCPRCTISLACYNECGRCELCPGKTLADLPADCQLNYTCDNAARCSPEVPCADAGYCLHGCCMTVLF